MTLFDKEKREHLNAAAKACAKSRIYLPQENKYNSFSKIHKERHPVPDRLVTNPLLGR